MLYLKQSVVGEIDPISFAIGFMAGLRSTFDKDCIVTSMNDSDHMPGSKHYIVDSRGFNKAADFRSHDLTDSQKEIILTELKRYLDNIGFDITFEFPGDPDEHFHIEYDPKPGEVFINRTI